jgi:hypothetical protein
MRPLTVAFISLLTVSQFASAQTQNSLLGKWDVTCAVRRESLSSMIGCGICMTEVRDSVTHETKNEDEAYFNVTKDSITITVGVSSQTVPYTWDNVKDIYKFTYNKIDYEFRLYYSEDMILQRSDGSILELKRIK